METASNKAIFYRDLWWAHFTLTVFGTFPHLLFLPLIHCIFLDFSCRFSRTISIVRDAVSLFIKILCNLNLTNKKNSACITFEHFTELKLNLKLKVIKWIKRVNVDSMSTQLTFWLNWKLCIELATHIIHSQAITKWIFYEYNRKIVFENHWLIVIINRMASVFKAQIGKSTFVHPLGTKGMLNPLVSWISIIFNHTYIQCTLL